MSQTQNYTPQQLTAAFDEIALSLFNDITAEPVPKILVVAGLQSSGKTYLLEKNLLPSGRYNNYVRLYLPEYREKHPYYKQLMEKGILYAYEHTEAFIRDIGKKIFERAFTQKYNIIMEAAFDSQGFADFPPLATAVGYQFETHVVACCKDFAHLSSIKRAFKSIQAGEMERFVTVPMLDASLDLAKAALPALEMAAQAVSGSRFYFYERGFGALKERQLRAQSTYTRDAGGTLTLTGDQQNYASLFEKTTRRPLYELKDREEMVKECHQALLAAQISTTPVPDSLYHDLYSYILRYVYR
ncbi:UNVERIFIED_ORG: hypothetical protein J2Y77_005428 [Pseudomonas lini]|uniref:Zeta toxin family protein n=1 Tax=Pseudomonas viciae TaxID=2505979 RepID=A0ABY8PFX5_9PSED|nr:zeta toxin family protein [Pseudomonas viciae]UZE87105.1 zeta toxin family protein [Pseudomonas viciae]WGO94064.1 zeta toxin family protein [Pseudomonas viciae]